MAGKQFACEIAVSRKRCLRDGLMLGIDVAMLKDIWSCHAAVAFRLQKHHVSELESPRTVAGSNQAIVKLNVEFGLSFGLQYLNAD